MADVESRYEEHPASLFNEIRHYNAHIATCYLPDATKEIIEGNLTEAELHLKRAILDCFKFLNVYYYESSKKNERTWKHFDVTSIDNGEFYISYKKIKRSAVMAVRQAKKNETAYKEKALALFQEAYNQYSELDNLIYRNLSNIAWAKAKFSLRRIGKIFVELLFAIMAAYIVMKLCPSLDKLITSSVEYCFRFFFGGLACPW